MQQAILVSQVVRYVMQVSTVQRKFVLQMLSFSNFNKHLSAVRETHAIVKRAVELSTGSMGDATEGTIAWLQSHNIVGQLLRANLHQKQYVDQVRIKANNCFFGNCLPLASAVSLCAVLC